MNRCISALSNFLVTCASIRDDVASVPRHRRCWLPSADDDAMRSLQAAGWSCDVWPRDPRATLPRPADADACLSASLQCVIMTHDAADPHCEAIDVARWLSHHDRATGGDGHDRPIVALVSLGCPEESWRIGDDDSWVFTHRYCCKTFRLLITAVPAHAATTSRQWRDTDTVYVWRRLSDLQTSASTKHCAAVALREGFRFIGAHLLTVKHRSDDAPLLVHLNPRDSSCGDGVDVPSLLLMPQRPFGVLLTGDAFPGAFPGSGPSLLFEAVARLLDHGMTVPRLPDAYCLIEDAVEAVHVDIVIHQVRGEIIKSRGAMNLAHALRQLGPLGLARLLGCRVTHGTKAATLRGALPLAPSMLIAAFEQPHGPAQRLSVGARALAKHFARDESNAFWGTGSSLTGPDPAKNAASLERALAILSGTVWCNVHVLPHDVVAVEYRNAAGYGARWTVSFVSHPERPGHPCPIEPFDMPDRAAGVVQSAIVAPLCDFTRLSPSAEALNLLSSLTFQAALMGVAVEFRGFLEPHAEDGHEKGWHH